MLPGDRLGPVPVEGVVRVEQRLGVDDGRTFSAARSARYAVLPLPYSWNRSVVTERQSRPSRRLKTPLVSLDPVPHSVDSVVPTSYWHALDDGRIQCDVCPRACKLREGQRGLCFV